MIVKFIIETASFLAIQCFNLISSILPHNDFNNTLLTLLDSIISICTQACNFFYFIFGDYTIIILPLVFSLIACKFIVAPILRFVIGFIHWGG